MNRFYMWENFANYNRSFGKHTINAMVGMSYQYEWSNFTSGSTNGLTDSSSNFHHLTSLRPTRPKAWAAE